MPKYILNKGFITQKIGDKTTVFSGEESLLFTFNDSAALIFQGLKLGWDEQKIIQKLIEKYKIPKSQAQKDLAEFTQELLKRKIISKSLTSVTK